MERQRQSYFSNGPSNDANEKVRVLIMKVDHGKYMQIEKSVNQVIILALHACLLQHDNLFLQFYHI